MRIEFRSFRTRILTFVLGLLVAAQGLAFGLVNRANVANARRHLEETLELTARAFHRSLEARRRVLTEKVRLLSADFAFKEAAATGDPATVLSALENHRDRVDADVMMLVSLDGRVIADTLHPEAAGAFPVPELLEAAALAEGGEVSALAFLDERPHQLVVVPLFAPEPVAWIVIGFAVEDGFARELEEETGTHVSLVGDRRGGPRAVLASTLPPALREALPAGLAAASVEAGRAFALDLGADAYLSLLAPVAAAGPTNVSAVLQRSLDEALAPYLRLRAALAGVFGLGVALSLLGSVLLASRVTRPVALLARGARRVEEGDFTEPVSVSGGDELGLLAGSFNHMMRGLAERDRVRSLLGKVVSPAIAEELLRKEIELGGEERMVTVLFTDVRGFTTLAEHESPRAVVDWLNTYLTRISATVERHGGVVDKYIGDGVMALFGAPLTHADDPSRAVHAALEMRGSLAELNRELAAKGAGPLAIGIGIHTDLVVAGNMGSKERLNYTVIGDGVNLASRIEGLTKHYGVPVIVSETTRKACPGIGFREVDRVRVKGREAPVSLFEPVGLEGALDPALLEALERHREALDRFRARDFAGARAGFEALAARFPEDPLYRLYTERADSFRAEPPEAGWDGTVTWIEK